LRIALDGMGTDRAPMPEVTGALQALTVLESDIEVVLIGDEEILHKEIGRHTQCPERLHVHHASDRVTAGDAAASVIRKKPESSIVVGLRLQQEGEVDAFVSAGSTGAIMATSLFTLRRLPGIDRPAVGTPLPSIRDPFLLIDSGANVDCKPEHLVQFAHLGSVYARHTMGRAEPRVSLLNVGKEPGKGGELVADTYDLLAEEPGICFVGNAEGRDLLRGECDVVVCDGFVGNVLLKFYEEVAASILSPLGEERDVDQESGGLRDVFRILDHAETGGAPLLGVGGVSIICHGESPPRAIRNAISVAARAVRSDMVGHSARNIGSSSTRVEGMT